MSPMSHGGSGVLLDGCISLLFLRKVTFMYRTAIVNLPITPLTCSIKQSQSKRFSTNHYSHCIIVKHLQATSNSNLYINFNNPIIYGFLLLLPWHTTEADNTRTTKHFHQNYGPVNLRTLHLNKPVKRTAV